MMKYKAMRKIGNNGFLIIIYAVIFSLVVLIPQYSNVFFLVLVVANAFFLCTSSENKASVLLSSLLIGSELFAVLNIVGYIFISAMRDKINVGIKSVKRIDFALFMVITASAFVNAIYSNGIWSFLFSVLYIVLLVVTYKFSNIDFEKYNIVGLIKAFVIIEFIVTLMIAIKYKRIIPGDLFGGSLMNAHYFANWLILTLFVILNVKKDGELIVSVLYRNIIYIVLILIMIFLASANAVTISAFVSVILYFVFTSLRKKTNNDLFWLIVFSYIGMYLVLYIFNIDIIRNFITSKFSTMSPYIYDYGWNYKFSYLYGTFYDSLYSGRVIFGYGLGQYGSRFANAFAYNVMWRSDNSVNKLIENFFEPHCIPEYYKYISFYDKSFVEGILWRSAVLSYPFSSFVALIGELGIVGVCVVAKWINQIFGKCKCKIIIYYFLIVCVFDIFFDDYQCVLALIVYMAMVGKGKLKEE